MTPQEFASLKTLLAKFVQSGQTELATMTRGILSTDALPRTVAISGLTETIDLSQGNLFKVTLGASTTLTLSNPQETVYIFKLIQGAAGSNTVTWPSNVVWTGDVTPTLTTTLGAWDIITLVWDGVYFSGTSTLNFTV